MPESKPENARFEYAAKVVCGLIPAEPVAPPIPPCVPGFYASAVNIHNPSRKEGATIWAKFAHAPQATDYGNPHIGGGVSPWVKYELKPDQAMELDCDFLLYVSKLGDMNIGGFAKGFVVLQSTESLDVVTVYTAGPVGRTTSHNPGAATMGAVATMHTERAPERLLR
jgi:hypothetical protein